MEKQTTKGWNRRRFLGAAAGSLAVAPAALSADEQDLPGCKQEAQHGPWAIEANTWYYAIARVVEAHGVGDAVLQTYRTDDGHARPPSGGIRVTEKDDGVTVQASVPKHFTVDEEAFRLEHSRESARVHFWRQSDNASFYLEALLIVDGRRIARGPAVWNEEKATRTVGLRFDWSANPLPAMRAGREAVLQLANGNGDTPGVEVIRLPIDLGGVTAASDKGATLQREAARRREAGKCSTTGCYLTTACCGHFGRPDTCWELETLRWYRDRVLTRQADGPEALATYYRTAPAIVAALPARGFRRSLSLAGIYWGTVIPCALLVRCRAYALARRHYERTFHRLRARWLSV